MFIYNKVYNKYILRGYMSRKLLLNIFFLFIMSCNVSNEKLDNSSERIIPKLDKISETIKKTEKRSFEPKKIRTIESENREWGYLKFDVIKINESNEIYFLDAKRCKILKTDFKGNLITIFGGKGNGPGESINPIDMIIINDTINVGDAKLKKTLKYGSNGIFISDLIHEDLIIPKRIKIINDSSIIGFISKAYEKGKSLYHSNSLTILDRNYKELTESLWKYETKIPARINGVDYTTPFAVSKIENKLYVAENSTNEYKIKIYNFEGKLINTIQKNYSSIEYNDNDNKKHRREGITSIGVTNPRDVKLKEVKYKKAIRQIACDKYGRLLVFPSVQRNKNNKDDFYVDIFKDDIFVERIKVDLIDKRNERESGKYINFVRDVILVNDKANGKLTIYNY